MVSLAIPFPVIDPVLFGVGPLQVRWYGLAYVAGIVGAWLLGHYLAERHSKVITAKHIDDFITWVVVSIIVGGRLGHVLFYEPLHFLQNPHEILMTWKGGMSFMGACLECLWVCGYLQENTAFLILR